MSGGREVVELPDRAAWRAWLAANHERSTGVWLAMPRKGSDASGPSYDDAIEEALCYGWVDSTARALDERRTLLYFARRKPRGKWSQSNKERVDRLSRKGLLAPAGIAAIERARENGSWTALDAVDALEVPDDLAAALVASPEAGATFEALSPSAKKGFLWWIVSAKRPETRARRVAASTLRLEQGHRTPY